jgi:hypothetical protein
MGLELHTPIDLTRDCEATLIPGGQKMTLSQGDNVVLTQALGGSFTVQTERGYLARIAVQDADALGLEGEQANEERVEAGPFELQQVIETLKFSTRRFRSTSWTWASSTCARRTCSPTVATGSRSRCP